MFFVVMLSKLEADAEAKCTMDYACHRNCCQRMKLVLNFGDHMKLVASNMILSNATGHVCRRELLIAAIVTCTKKGQISLENPAKGRFRALCHINKSFLVGPKSHYD
ncbi:hypothetical protein Leryth_021935 [Lithospermum erythrorhizon]|nr:hypothetical protein Leryth_021935 [Lithospermum erythrorhizon]